MSYRPDELANLSEKERDAMMRQNIRRGVETAATVASAYTGANLAYSPLAQKILPYLSSSLPVGAAVKAIQKISPKTADFLKRGQDLGLNIHEGMEFIKDRLGTKETEKSKSLFHRLLGDVDLETLDKNIQRQLQFLAPIAAQLEKKGKDENDPGVKKLKNKIRKILQGSPGTVIEETARVHEGYPEMQNVQTEQPQPLQEQVQPGQGQQALMAILQKIQAQRGL